MTEISTLNFADLAHNVPLIQTYGDRLSTTPNIEIDYTTTDSNARWDSYDGNNDAPPVNGWENGVAQLQGSGSFDLKFTPDQGAGVLVKSFDLVDYMNFAAGHTVNWSLVDISKNTTLFSGAVTLNPNEKKSITTGMTEAYDSALTLRLNHLSGDTTDLAIDNVAFSQEVLGDIETPSSLINGIASGDTTQTKTVLWARSNKLGELSFEYSTDANFTNILGKKTASVTDTTLPVKVNVDNLTPNTQYYYRVTDMGGNELSGKVKTPAAEGQYAGLTFGVINCYNQAISPFIAVNNVPERNLDFLVTVGDSVYQDFVFGIPSLRNTYSMGLSEDLGVSPLAEARASATLYATIDDHEVTDNFQGGAITGSGNYYNQGTKYNDGLQTFYEYMPIREEFYQGTGNPVVDGRPNLYRYQKHGSDAAMITLDTRSFRDAHLNSNSPNFLSDSLTLDRTMITEVQLNALKQDLLDAETSGITWKFINTSIEMQQWGTFFAEDRWEGFAKERTEILKFIKDNDIDNVVFISGDWHGYDVNNILYQEVPGGELIATSAFEVVVGSVSSNPYGPSWINRGNLTPEERALFNSAPIKPDTDSILNDKDDFLKKVIDEDMEVGYDPMGLNRNLPQAEGLIDAQLLEGDYVGNFHNGWTEFDINPETQQLTVTTFGILPYTRSQLQANPSLLEQEPVVINKFIVNPQVDVPPPPTEVFGTPGADVFDAATPDARRFVGVGQNLFTSGGNDTVDVSQTAGGNRLDLGSGDDTLFAGSNNRILAGSGADKIFLGYPGGNNVVTGGSGADQFWLLTDEVDLPTEANIITDFALGTDVLGFGGTSLNFNALTLTQQGANTVINALGEDLAILQNVQTSSLSAANFVFA